MLTRGFIRTCVTSMAIGALSVAGIAAQSAKPTTLTITGCLQGPIPGDEYAQSGFGPGPVSAADANATYRLTNVTMKPMPAGGAVYLVVGNEKQLSAHLGHQVQIVGTVVTRESRGTTGNAPAPPTADEYYESTAGKPKPATAATPAVRAESVRMVSTKCSPGR